MPRRYRAARGYWLALERQRPRVTSLMSALIGGVSAGVGPLIAAALAAPAHYSLAVAGAGFGGAFVPGFIFGAIRQRRRARRPID